VSQDPYTGVDNLEVLAAAVNYNRFLVDRVAEAAAGAKEAVDFGAGTGTLSGMVRERGLAVTCVEADAGLRERLVYAGLVAHSSLDDLPDDSCGFIYSLNVLEHIEDDVGALRALGRVLEPSGRMFLYVPAFAVLFSSMDRKVGHHRRYRRSTLRRACEDAGLVVERIEYADSLGFAAALLYKWFGSREGAISDAGVRLYDRVAFPVSRLLDRLGCRWLFGKNVMATVRSGPVEAG
jgi:SAM-dependent methyltransferase